MESEARAVETAERDAFEDLFAAAPADVAARLGVRTARHGSAVSVHVPPAPVMFMNRAFAFGEGGPAREEELAAAIAALRASGAPKWGVQIADDADPPALHEWARARGLERQPHGWAKMARGPEPEVAVHTTLDVREVGPERAVEFGQVVAASFGMPPPFAAWNAALVGRARWRTYGSFEGDRMVGAGALFLRGDGVGWLGIGGTLATHRGRGGQGAVMARRIRDAFAAGCRLVVTETGDRVSGQPSPSYDNMLRCGFRVVHVRPTYK